MRRWLTVVLILFISLQASLAVVVSYGQHVKFQTESNLGHHVHDLGLETATADLTSVDDSLVGASPGFLTSSDPDCAACQANFLTGLPSAPQPAVLKARSGKPAAPVPGPVSAPVDTPDRPKWTRTA